MLVRKKTKDLTCEEIERLYSINKARCTEDYANFSADLFNVDNITLISFYEYRYHDYEVIMGDDWYILFKQNDYLVEIDHFYALPKVTNKRVVEIIRTLKNLMIEFNGKLCFALMRHDTSYKLFSALENRGYIEKVDVSSMTELGDTTIDEKIKLEFLKNGFLSNEDYYKCLNHLVFFRIGKEKNIEMQEKQDLYIYLLKNRRNEDAN